MEAWEKGSAAGRREAFRHARALLSSLGLARGQDPVELAEAVCRKTRRKESAASVVELLRELPEERGSPALLLPALRTILERGNDGVVALLTATAPPKGVELSAEIAKKGLVLEVGIGEMRDALPRYARARAREREVTLDADAVERLRFQTDEQPELFAAELSKLLEWAGKGGRVRARRRPGQRRGRGFGGPLPLLRCDRPPGRGGGALRDCNGSSRAGRAGWASRRWTPRITGP